MYKKEIIRVKANKKQMKKMYGKFSKIYGFIEKSEKSLRKRSLDLLSLKINETVLEIGFGKGTTLLEILKFVGEGGNVYGIDLTPEMVYSAKKKLARAGLLKKVNLFEGDARSLPYDNNMFDAVYIASTLELFDTPDIPIVLNEIKRVLKTGGRLCVVSIPKEGREKKIGVKLFEWSHRTFPKYASCRPIFIEDSLKNAGYIIIYAEILGTLSPMKIVIARPKSSINKSLDY
jgi:demethylmenaquinone methyltransferase/2-methoxy-6-polyprenyl-1,4-benzoquinol methylase